MAKSEINSKNDWEETTDRFVAFFDIMGFKDLVLKTEHNKIVELLKTLSKSRAKLEEKNYKELASGTKYGETKSFTFSDSIFFFSKSDSKGDALKLLHDCLILMKIALENNIPIKGAVSYGKITIDLHNSIFFGQPIIDAFLLQEELQLYSVISDHSFQKKIKELEVKLLEGIFKFYKTPLKSGKVNHYILKPVKGQEIKTKEYLDNLYLTVSGKPRQYIDNTIEFVDSIK